jgi:hypothetical protein
MTGHLDADTLAEYREDLLGRRRSARIRAHLAGCSRCAAVDRELAEVSTLLAAAPAPSMPDALASRLQGVLAAEAAARAAQNPAPAENLAAQPGRHTATPSGRRRAGHTTRTPRQRRVLVLRVASATAVVAALAAGGFGLAHLSGGSSATGSSAAGPAGVPLQSGAGNRHASGNMGPDISSGGSSISVAGGTVPVLHSGRDYLPANLTAQAEAELGRPPGTNEHATSSPGTIIAGGSQTAAALAGCVRRVTGGVVPTLVDQARYQGRPATVIVQAPAAGRAGQVWVTGPGCSSAHPDLLTHAQLAAAG